MNPFEWFTSNPVSTSECVRKRLEEHKDASYPDDMVASYLASDLREIVVKENPLSDPDNMYTQLLNDAINSINYVKLAKALILWFRHQKTGRN